MSAGSSTVPNARSLSSDSSEVSWWESLKETLESWFHRLLERRWFRDDETTDLEPNQDLRRGLPDSRRFCSEETFQRVSSELLRDAADGGPSTTMALSNRVPTVIQHCRQLETWDCGIACVQMALRWLRDESADTSLSKHELQERQSMVDWIGTRSVWTVDLVFLLKSFQQTTSFRFLFASQQLTNQGCWSQYDGMDYYHKKASFSEDQQRVSRLLEELHRLQLPTLSESLTMDQVVHLVSHQDCIAIVLVDNNRLYPTLYGKKQYAGHYVVLCGISSDPRHCALALQDDPSSSLDYCLVLQNPDSSSPATAYCSARHLERAWRAPGTDDDILFLVKSLE